MSGPLNDNFDPLEKAAEDSVVLCLQNDFPLKLFSSRKIITFDQKFKGSGFKTSVL